MTQTEIEQKLAELEEWLSLISAQKYPGANTLGTFKKAQAEFFAFVRSQETRANQQEDSNA